MKERIRLLASRGGGIVHKGLRLRSMLGVLVGRGDPWGSLPVRVMRIHPEYGLTTFIDRLF